MAVPIRTINFIFIFGLIFITWYKTVVAQSNSTGNTECPNLFRSIGPNFVSVLNDLFTENIPNATVTGPLTSFMRVGSSAYVSSPSGGIWQAATVDTSDTVFGPHWVALSNDTTCNAITAMAVSLTDTNVLVAGCGLATPVTGFWEGWGRLILSMDGGKTFTSLVPLPMSVSISSILVFGNTIIVGARYAHLGDDSFDIVQSFFPGGGLWASFDLGKTWTNPLAAQGNPIWSLATANLNPSGGNTTSSNSTMGRIWALGGNGVTRGLWASNDGGHTWSDESGSLLALANCPTVAAVQNGVISVHPSDPSHVYAVYYTNNNNGNAGNNVSILADCYDFFGTIDNGNNWFSFVEPTTMESIALNGTSGNNTQQVQFGLGPQGFIYLALTIDPMLGGGNSTNVTFVQPFDVIYVGGSFNFPGDSLGARALTGRLFRGMVTPPATTGGNSNSTNTTTTPSACVQWQPITHSGTSSSSAPPMGSRWLTYDQTNNFLVYTCDGGLFYLSSPQTSSGDWFSWNGDLGISDVISFAFDHRSEQILLATYLAGLQLQTANGSNSYQVISPIQTFSVDLDDMLASPPVFYATTTLGALVIGRLPAVTPPPVVTNSTNNSTGNSTLIPSTPVANVTSPLVVEWQSPSLFQNWFAPLVPIQLNRVDPRLLLFCGKGNNNLQPGCVNVRVDADPNSAPLFSPNVTVPIVPAAYVYGGYLDGKADKDLLIAVDEHRFFRANGVGNDGGWLEGPWSKIVLFGHSLAVNPYNYSAIALVDTNSDIWYSKDFGQNWWNITGGFKNMSLLSLPPTIVNGTNGTASVFSNIKPLRALNIVIVPLNDSINAIVVGSNEGALVFTDDQLLSIIIIIMELVEIAHFLP